MPFMTNYKFANIILVGFPHTDLQSISKRPALVLYDSGDQDVIVSRITTQEYSTSTDYKVVEWSKCGLLAESYVRLSKLATIEKRYIIKPLGSLNSSEAATIKSIVRKMFSL